jgi:hypothetical protein
MAPGYGVRARTAGTFGPCRPFGSGLAAGLRVADASVMPLIPNAHPHATVLAIAERASALITAS